MIVLSGASASGKTEVAKILAKKYGIEKIITTTTRTMRVNEQNGRDYFFVSKDEFEKLIKADHFVEYTFYNGNYYGSSKDQINSNKCVVIDPSGLKAYINLNDPSIVTFLLEATEKTRYNRMILRGDSEENANARIQNDRQVFEQEKMEKMVDVIIDSENYNLDEMAKYVIKKYNEILANRQLRK